MAHGPSPFGVPHRAHEPRHAADDVGYGDRSGPAPDEFAAAPTEADAEQYLERIQASRPLRRAAQRARSRTRWWMVALAVVSGLAVVAACGAGAFIVMQEDETAGADRPSADQARSDEDEDAAPDVVDPIERRETDPEPVTAPELFGEGTIAPNGGAGEYAVAVTEELDECAEAALDELAGLLEDAACTQAVRATVVSPDGAHAATAGVLNLSDAAEAEALRDAIESGVDGGFAVLRTDGDAAELGRAATMLGYNTYGHYLMYVVVGGTDGEDLEAANDAVLTVVNDLVDVWLVDRLLPRRSVE